MRRLLLISALLAALLGAAPPASADSLEASVGATTATLSWEAVDELEARDLRLTITRAGATALERAVEVEGCAAPSCRPVDLKVADLDLDGEPEVLVDLFSGGAHCCVTAQVLMWMGDGYRTVEHGFGDAGYELTDVDRNGRPELLSADARFAYAFASFARSAFPVQVWQLVDGRLVDVSADHPAALRRDARRWYRLWKARRGDPEQEPLGSLSAWAADQHRLGQGARVRRELRRALRRGWLTAPAGMKAGRSYVVALNRLLRDLGYRA